MNEKQENLKCFQIRMPKEMWMFLKKASVIQETTMAEIIIRCINKYKSRMQDRLNFDEEEI